MTDITETAENTLADVVARVAGAMEEAVNDYGPDAVELALFAYQVFAIRTLLIAIVLASLTLLLPWAWRVAKKYADVTDNFSYVVAGILSFMVTLLAVGSLFVDLLNPALWLAAFGNPELMIATKALQAAGLL